MVQCRVAIWSTGRPGAIGEGSDTSGVSYRVSRDGLLADGYENVELVSMALKDEYGAAGCGLLMMVACHPRSAAQ